MHRYGSSSNRSVGIATGVAGKMALAKTHKSFLLKTAVFRQVFKASRRRGRFWMRACNRAKHGVYAGCHRKQAAWRGMLRVSGIIAIPDMNPCLGCRGIRLAER